MEQVKIAKVAPDQNLVFGWANVSVRKGETDLVTDSHGDQIPPDTLEEAAYLFNLAFRETGVMHKGEAVGQLVESFFVTPDKLEKMGLAPDALPTGWWVGFYVEDDAVFAKVKDGTYSMFSIQGVIVEAE